MKKIFIFLLIISALMVVSYRQALAQGTTPHDYQCILTSNNYEQNLASEKKSSIIMARTKKSGKDVASGRKKKKKLELLDDDKFANLTARLIIAGGKRTKEAFLLQLMMFSVSDNEESKAILKEYGITDKEFSQEYDRRMWPNNELNEPLLAKVTHQVEVLLELKRLREQE